MIRCADYEAVMCSVLLPGVGLQKSSITTELHSMIQADYEEYKKPVRVHATMLCERRQKFLDSISPCILAAVTKHCRSRRAAGYKRRMHGQIGGLGLDGHLLLLHRDIGLLFLGRSIMLRFVTLLPLLLPIFDSTLLLVLFLVRRVLTYFVP